MSNSSFKVGDVVQLKSGGPIMTVESSHTQSDGSVGVRWFAGDTVKYHAFKAEMLEPVEE